MARLMVERSSRDSDSDDERLPDLLAGLRLGGGGGGGSGAMKEMEGEKGTKKKMKKKKRVLVQRGENPLLKPLGREVGRRRVERSGDENAFSGTSFKKDAEVGEKVKVKELGRVMLVGEGRERMETKVREMVLEKTADRDLLATVRQRVEDDGDGDGDGDGDSLPKSAVSEKSNVKGSSETSVRKGRSASLDSANSMGTEENLLLDSDDDNVDDDDDDGLSDFVVNDDEILEEEDSTFEAPPPRRPRRRLVRGRRRAKEMDDELELGAEEVKLKDDGMTDSYEESGRGGFRESDNDHLDKEDRHRVVQDRERSQSRREASGPKQKMFEPSSDMEDPFTLRFSPSEKRPRKVAKENRLSTPPGSPEIKPKGLPSPKKIQRIPSTPHRPSMDSFWSQDVINDWNDDFSPTKTPKPSSRLLFTKDKIESPRKSPLKVDRVAKEAKEAKKAFAQRKHEIAESFLRELDTTITKGEVSSLSASTGGVKIIWSKKLSTTAGRANWKRETIRTNFGADAPPTVMYRHHAAIELAEKVIDDEDRLLNVIAHEFCHLANFMVSGVKTNPHGKEFKAWARKVSTRFGDRGIEVTTKHTYEIDYKYIWECENCGLEFKRHSKSIDPARHRCGACKSLLVQTKPVPRGGKDGEKSGLGEYQLFVKENMKVVRRENPGSPQKEIMGLVGKRYQEFKAAKALMVGGGVEKELVAVGVAEVVPSKESTPVEDDAVQGVVRKLDFLDLTSP